MKIILVSHGKLAMGMKDTLELIVGPRKDITAFEAYEDGKGEQFIEQIKNLVSNVNEQFIILTDILGGSVNNEMGQLLKDHSNIQLITGMNLPLVITLATQSYGLIDSRVINKLVKEGQNGVISINKIMKANIDEEIDNL